MCWRICIYGGLGVQRLKSGVVLEGWFLPLNCKSKTVHFHPDVVLGLVPLPHLSVPPVGEGDTVYREGERQRLELGLDVLLRECASAIIPFHSWHFQARWIDARRRRQTSGGRFIFSTEPMRGATSLSAGLRQPLYSFFSREYSVVKINGVNFLVY